jgi:hypothetical protein
VTVSPTDFSDEAEVKPAIDKLGGMKNGYARVSTGDQIPPCNSQH